MTIVTEFTSGACHIEAWVVFTFSVYTGATFGTCDTFTGTSNTLSADTLLIMGTGDICTITGFCRICNTLTIFTRFSGCTFDVCTGANAETGTTEFATGAIFVGTWVSSTDTVLTDFAVRTALDVTVLLHTFATVTGVIFVTFDQLTRREAATGDT